MGESVRQLPIGGNLKPKNLTPEQIEAEKIQLENERQKKILMYKKEMSSRLNNEWKIKLNELKAPNYA